MNNRNGGAAFWEGSPDYGGMTLRQYYKAAALPAVIHLLKDEATEVDYGEYVADLCKSIADAMLAEDENHEREGGE